MSALSALREISRYVTLKRVRGCEQSWATLMAKNLAPTTPSDTCRSIDGTILRSSADTIGDTQGINRREDSKVFGRPHLTGSKVRSARKSPPYAAYHMGDQFVESIVKSILLTFSGIFYIVTSVIYALNRDRCLPS